LEIRRFGKRSPRGSGQLPGEVARDYISLRALQARLAVAHPNLGDERKTLAIVRRRFSNGLTTKFDLLRADVQVAATESAIPPLEAGAAETIHQLSVLLGERPRPACDSIRRQCVC
jgi:outer membrane protein TolC